MIEEGYYEGKVVTAHVEVDDRNEGELTLCFNVRLVNGDTVTCRHRTGGEWGHIGKKVAESFGIVWPDGLESIGTVAGQACRVNIKHKESNTPGQPFVNAYIAVARGSEPATEEQVAAGIAKLRNVEDDNILF